MNESLNKFTKYLFILLLCISLFDVFKHFNQNILNILNYVSKIDSVVAFTTTIIFPLLFLAIIFSINKLENYSEEKIVKTGLVVGIIGCFFYLSQYLVYLVPSAALFLLPIFFLSIYSIEISIILLWISLGSFAVFLYKMSYRVLVVIIIFILLLSIIGIYGRFIIWSMPIKSSCEDKIFSIDSGENTALRDKCLQERQERENITLAFEKKNISYCVLVNDKKRRDNCIDTLLYRAEHYNEGPMLAGSCLVVNDAMRDKCLDLTSEMEQFNYAVSAARKYIEQLGYTVSDARVYSPSAEILNFTKEYCPHYMVDKNRDNCYIGLALFTQDGSYCDKVTISEKNICSEYSKK